MYKIPIFLFIIQLVNSTFLQILNNNTAATITYEEIENTQNDGEEIYSNSTANYFMISLLIVIGFCFLLLLVCWYYREQG